MDWLDPLAVQGTLKLLLEHHSSKASILRHSGFFIVQLSHPYMTTRKTIALTRWTCVGKVIPGLKDSTETETELCLSVSCRRTGQQWIAAGAGALGAVDLGMA